MGLLWPGESEEGGFAGPAQPLLASISKTVAWISANVFCIKSVTMLYLPNSEASIAFSLTIRLGLIRCSKSKAASLCQLLVSNPSIFANSLNFLIISF